MKIKNKFNNRIRIKLELIYIYYNYNIHKSRFYIKNTKDLNVILRRKDK